ncbi:hypothetical protein PC123_g16663 [Phytophthora cactorum]|nr:hypothetical protein PC123_g16663 [Phytophthora cactorum]
MGASPRAITDWTARTLIDPGRQRRTSADREPHDANEPAVSSPANFAPNPEPQQRDDAAVQDFKQYADQRGRKNVEQFSVGDRVLLSTTGLRPTLVTNLGASKLAPRYIGPFKVTKVLSDAYTLQLLWLSGYILPSTWGACVDITRPLFPATLVPGASVPAIHAVAQLRILLFHLVQASKKATQKLRARSLLSTDTIHGSSATVLLLLSIARVTSAISWRQSSSTTMIALIHSEITALTAVTVAPLHIANTWCVGLTQFLIVWSHARHFSPTFRTAWRSTRLALPRIGGN